ncbi:MAG: Gfo/Idh/MocA family oxidoreductase [Bacteroidota bacterium]
MSTSVKYSAPLRWGIIGSGDVTEVKSGPAYQMTEGFELHAVMRRNLEKVKDYAQRHQVAKYYTDADALINDEEIDAVYIATPPDTHQFYALKVAAAGKPCCVEKPLAPSYQESKAIFEAFHEKGIPLFSAYYRRSMPRFNQVQEWLKAEKIGEVRHVSWLLCQPPSDLDKSEAYNWRTDQKVAPGGYFDDLASHGLDLIIHYLGNIKSVLGHSLNQQQLYDAKDAVVACWLHEKGITGTGSWHFGASESIDRLEILGSKGKIQFSVFADNPLLLLEEGRKQEVVIENIRHIQLHHVENMKRQLLDGDFEHPSTGQSAAHTSWVMDQILKGK